MKYLLAGDYHGKSLGKLKNEIESIGPDVLISLGDFDQIRTIQDFMEIEENMVNSNKTVISVPGNHDDAVLNDMWITSGTLRMQGKESHELHEELMRNPEAKRYLDNLLNCPTPGRTNKRIGTNLDEERYANLYKTLIIHGALEGDLHSYPGCPDDEKDLWIRLRSEEDYRNNFEAMDEKGYKIMMRGHDHEPKYVYRDPEKGIVQYKPEKNGDGYRLFERRSHVINPGAFFEGWFAVIYTDLPEEKNPVLEYHRI